MSKSRKVRLVLALGATVLAAAPVALASGGSPKVPSYSGPSSKGDLQARPKTIVYTADDSGFWAGAQFGHTYASLKWSSWTSTSAKGSGFDWVNSCRPNCASGTLHPYPVKLKLGRPRTEGSHLVFSRLTETFTGNRPPHTSHSTYQWEVAHRGRSYIWTFPNQ
jgi:hypothetical protein